MYRVVLERETDGSCPVVRGLSEGVKAARSWHQNHGDVWAWAALRPRVGVQGPDAAMLYTDIHGS